MRTRPGVIAFLGTAILVSSAARGAVAGTLVEPKMLIVDSSLPEATRDAEVLAARRYDTFWNTGDPALAELALAKGFVDETPPLGRLPGRKGPLAASQAFRAAVPDLTYTVEQIVWSPTFVSRGISPARSRVVMAKAKISVSSRPTSTASPTAASPPTGTSKTI